MRASATPVQFPTLSNGATVRGMPGDPTDYYPAEEASPINRKATTVRLLPDRHAQVEFLAELWNSMDKALGRKRRRRWKASSVMERLVNVSADGFLGQLGGMPKTREDRERVIHEAVALAKRAHSKK